MAIVDSLIVTDPGCGGGCGGGCGLQVDGQISGSLRVTASTILRKEGVLAFYRGLMPTLIRSFPANGALFVTYEYARTLLMPVTPFMADI